MVTIALQNLHKLPQMTDVKIHNYVLEMIKQGYIQYLYFDDYNFFTSYGQVQYKAIQEMLKKYSYAELGLGKAQIIFSPKILQEKCDVLLNFNVTRKEEFTEVVKNFEGIKIFHLMDYFWIEPTSSKNERLKKFNIDYVMSYGFSDKHCPYFQHHFPDYIDKLIPVPFGYHSRFINKNPFEKRLNKCIALGSVNPSNRMDAPIDNWRETVLFYPDEAWLHKFRRMLVKEKDNLKSCMDSSLAEYPKIREQSTDVVQKFNEYQMFVGCETLFYFPTAKTYEGLASGCVLVCSDHPCFTEYGFIDGINCVKHKQFDVNDFKEKVTYYLSHQEELKQIQQRGITFVNTRYSHPIIAQKLYHIIDMLYRGKQPDYSAIWQRSCEELTKNEDVGFGKYNDVHRKNAEDESTTSRLFSRNRRALQKYQHRLKYVSPIYQVPKKIGQISKFFVTNLKNFGGQMFQLIRD